MTKFIYLIALLPICLCCSPSEQQEQIADDSRAYSVINDTFDLFEGRDTIPSGLIPPPLVYPFKKTNKAYDESIKAYLSEYQEKNLVVFTPDTMRAFNEWSELSLALQKLNIRENGKSFFKKKGQKIKVVNASAYTFSPKWLLLYSPSKINDITSTPFNNLGLIVFSEVLFSEDGTYACYTVDIACGRSGKTSICVAKYQKNKWIKVYEEVLLVA